jgi:hypothetical protein
MPQGDYSTYSSNSSSGASKSGAIQKPALWQLPALLGQEVRSAFFGWATGSVVGEGDLLVRLKLVE